jgi:hypothetical protein
MTRRSILGWGVGVALLLTLPAWAAEYRLQVANLDWLQVSAYTDRPLPGQPGGGSLARLETRLDTMEFPAGAVIPGRDVVLLQDPAYGGRVPERVAVLPTTKEQAWTTFVWDGEPGDTVTFVVKSIMSAWQEAWFIGANPEGTLRRLVLGNPSWFGNRSYEVPQVSYNFLANAIDQGSFPSWMAENAPSLHGMSIINGQGRDRYNYPDWVYVVLKLAPQPRTYKVVIGWRNTKDRSENNNRRLIN